MRSPIQTTTVSTILPSPRTNSASAREGIEVAVIATANDYDPDGDPIAIVEVTSGGRGNVSILDSTTLVYTPNAGMVGMDTFTYTISDPSGQRAEADVSVEMIAADAPNRPPIANPDKAATVASKAVVVDVLRNDFDPERTQLSVADITPPDTATGSVERTILPDGRTALKFTPADAFVGGTATFSYRAGDADEGKSNSAEVTVTVAGVGAREPTSGSGSRCRPNAGRTERADCGAGERHRSRQRPPEDHGFEGDRSAPRRGPRVGRLDPLRPGRLGNGSGADRVHHLGRQRWGGHRQGSRRRVARQPGERVAGHGA